MRHAAICLAVLLTGAAPLTAQDGPAAAPLAVRETAVVFSVQGRIGAPTGLATLPTVLVERLSRDPALASLEIGPPSGVVVARFFFADEASFRAWYARAETRETFQALEGVLLHAEYAFTLKRYPAASAAEAARATP